MSKQQATSNFDTIRQCIRDNSSFYLSHFTSYLSFDISRYIVKRNPHIADQPAILSKVMNEVREQFSEKFMDYLITNPQNMIYRVKYPFVKTLYSLNLIESDPSSYRLSWLSNDCFVDITEDFDRTSNELKVVLGRKLTVNSISDIEKHIAFHVSSQNISQYSEYDIAFAMLDAFCIKSLKLSDDWSTLLEIRNNKRGDRALKAIDQAKKLFRPLTLQKILDKPVNNTDELTEMPTPRGKVKLTAKLYVSIVSEATRSVLHSKGITNADEFLKHAFSLYIANSDEFNAHKLTINDYAKKTKNIFPTDTFKLISAISDITIEAHEIIDKTTLRGAIRIPPEKTFLALHSALKEKASNPSPRNSAMSNHYEYTKEILARIKNMGANHALLDTLEECLIKEYSALTIINRGIKAKYHRKGMVTTIINTIKQAGGDINNYGPLFAALSKPVSIVPSVEKPDLFNPDNFQISILNSNYYGATFDVSIDDPSDTAQVDWRLNAITKLKKALRESNVKKVEDGFSSSNWGAEVPTDKAKNNFELNFNHINSDGTPALLAGNNSITLLQAYLRCGNAIALCIEHNNTTDNPLPEPTLIRHLTSALFIANVYTAPSISRLVNIMVLMEADSTKITTNLPLITCSPDDISYLLYDMSLLNVSEALFDAVIDSLRGKISELGNVEQKSLPPLVIPALTFTGQIKKAYKLNTFLMNEIRFQYNIIIKTGIPPHVLAQEQRGTPQLPRLFNSTTDIDEILMLTYIYYHDCYKPHDKEYIKDKINKASHSCVELLKSLSLFIAKGADDETTQAILKSYCISNNITPYDVMMTDVPENIIPVLITCI